MRSSPSDTARLVRRAVEGDAVATETLLARFRPQLRQMVVVRMDSRLKTRFDPSDVVQIVLTEAAQKMSRFQNQPELFFPWLRQLAWDELARLHRDHIRTARRSVVREQTDWQSHVTDESMIELADRLACQQPGPGSRLVRKEIRARVRAAIEQLPSQDREILVLRFLEQLSVSDAAAALTISEAAVKSRQFRAVERLGALLTALQAEDEL